MRKTLMLCAALCLSACADNRPIVSTPPAACADLVPSNWSEGVTGAAIPENASVTLGVPLTAEVVARIIAPWAAGFVDAAGRLEIANDRSRQSTAIVRECERLANEARITK